jgi:hypothetical protein
MLRLLKRQITKQDIRVFQSWIFAVLLFIQIPPFYFWSTPFLVKLFPFLCGVLIVLNIERNRNAVIQFFIFMVFYLYVAVRDEVTFNGTLNLLVVAMLFLMNRDMLVDVFRKFSIIYAIMLIPSIAVYFLVFVFGVNLPFYQIEPWNELKNVMYDCYPFLTNASELTIPRFHSYFDEPGVVGTISAIILLVSGYNLKDKINIPILIAGLISFSFAFYLITFIYAICFFKTKAKIIFAILTVIFAVLFYNNENIAPLIFDRFVFTDGSFAGDNRVSDKYAFETFKNSENYYLGASKKFKEQVNPGGASYKDLIVSYGFIWFIAYCVFYFFVSFFKFKFKKEFWVFILVFVSIIYQRPFITSFSYVFLLVAPLFVLQNKLNLRLYDDKSRK